MTDPYIRLHSGTKFHILSPKASEIKINDIAYALSNICRFTGHTSKFYSVAQHCCLVSDILPKNLKLQGLLHDAQESYCSDIASPLKRCLPQYIELENRIEVIIADKFDFPFPMPSEIKVADMRLLVTEMRDLMKGGDYKNLPFVPLDNKIRPWSSKKAREEYLKRYKKYIKY